MLSDNGSNFTKPRAYRLAQDLIQRSQGSLNESAIIAYLQNLPDAGAATHCRAVVISVVPPHGDNRAPGGLGYQRGVLPALPRSGSAMGRPSYRRGPPRKRRIQSGCWRRMESEDYVRAQHFLMVLAEQLQGEENTFASVQHWIEERLQPTAHGSGSGRAHAGSRGKRRDGAGVRQPSSSFAARLHQASSKRSAWWRRNCGSIRPAFTPTATLPLGIAAAGSWSRPREPAERKNSRSRILPSPWPQPRKIRPIGMSRTICWPRAVAQLEQACRRAPALQDPPSPLLPQARDRRIPGRNRRADGFFRGHHRGPRGRGRDHAASGFWRSSRRWRCFRSSELSIQIVNALVISLFPPVHPSKDELQGGHSVRPRDVSRGPDDACRARPW